MLVSSAAAAAVAAEQNSLACHAGMLELDRCWAAVHGAHHLPGRCEPAGLY